MISGLLLGGTTFVELEEIDGKYKLHNLTSMNNSIEGYSRNVEIRLFSLYCTATKKNKDYRVKLIVKNTEDENWFKGKIIFPSAPV